MEKLVSAADANRKFSKLLRAVREGKSYVMASHGRAVARIVPTERDSGVTRGAKVSLLKRLGSEPAIIGFPQADLGHLQGAGGTQRLPRTIGTPAALMHILMGQPLNPREAERKGLVHETVSGKALDRAMEIARRLSSHTPESLAYIKRLVRNATETPLAQGLALERNLFLKLCVSESALARMRCYEGKKITSPSRGFEV